MVVAPNDNFFLGFPDFLAPIITPSGRLYALLTAISKRQVENREILDRIMTDYIWTPDVLDSSETKNFQGNNYSDDQIITPMKIPNEDPQQKFLDKLIKDCYSGLQSPWEIDTTPDRDLHYQFLSVHAKNGWCPLTIPGYQKTIPREFGVVLIHEAFGLLGKAATKCLELGMYPRHEFYRQMHQWSLRSS